MPRPHPLTIGYNSNLKISSKFPISHYRKIAFADLKPGDVFTKDNQLYSSAFYVMLNPALASSGQCIRIGELSSFAY